MDQVTSRHNPLLKRFREVARDGRSGATVLLDGPHLLQEALRSGIALEVLAVSTAAAARETPLVEACARAGARVVALSDPLAESISPVRQASGMVALARITPIALDAALAAGSPALVLLLDAVQDPGNVGAIVRTAEACGGTAVIVGPGSADPFGWKALRGSMGSAFRLPVVSVDDLGPVIDTLRRRGVRTLAAVPRGGTALPHASLAGPCAILLGGEGAGVAPELATAAGEAVTFEMRPPVESLNVSVAAALVLYEASRQRADVAVR